MSDESQTPETSDTSEAKTVYKEGFSLFVKTRRSPATARRSGGRDPGHRLERPVDGPREEGRRGGDRSGGEASSSSPTIRSRTRTCPGS